MGQDRNDFEDRINNIVDNALRSNDFDDLSKKINNVVSSTLENFQKAGKMAGYGREEYERRKAFMNSYSPGGATTARPSGTNYRETGANRHSRAAVSEATRRMQQAKAEQDALFKDPPEDTSGKLMTILGVIASVIFAGLTIGGGLFGLITGAAVATLSAIIFLVLTVASVGITVSGVRKLGFVSRFRNYCREAFKKKYISIKELASTVNRSEESVLKDIKRLIASGSFKQGHLDHTESTLIITDELYRQYEQTQRRSDELKAEEQKRVEEGNAISADVKKVLTTGEDYIEKIKRANASLPDKEMTEKLTRLELIISKIFARVKERPKEARRLDQFMEYYLPTTWKLISAYMEMDKQDFEGETIKTAKKEILESLDSISNAYEKLLDSMFADKALDVSTDISVMQAMMKQDGLAESDFKDESQMNFDGFSEGLESAGATQTLTFGDKESK